MLVKDLQVQLIRPPVNIRVGFVHAVRYRHFDSVAVFSFGTTLPDEFGVIFICFRPSLVIAYC